LALLLEPQEPSLVLALQVAAAPFWVLAQEAVELS
jgi:hypothetical protein